MKILETLKINNDLTALVCEPFMDSQITSVVSIGNVRYENFSIPKERGLFSQPKTRTIVVHNDIKIQDDEIYFV